MSQAIPTHVALVRGINVGGRNRVAMSDLRDLLAQARLSGGRSLLQSGNVVFASEGRTCDELERLLEEQTSLRLGLRPDYFVRTTDEWEGIVARNPFPDEAERDPGHLLVMLLKHAPTAAALQSLRLALKGSERIHADGRQLYLVYPDGIGRSKLTNTLIEKHLSTRGTARNWNTVLKLAAMTR